MRIRSVKPYEIPLYLLRQKTSWNLEEFFRCALIVTNWYGYVWGDPGEEWAAMILVDDPIYDSIVCDTVIIDEGCQALVPEVLRSGWQEAERLAREQGRRYVSAFSFSPKRHLAILGHPKGVRRLETRLQKEISRC